MSYSIDLLSKNFIEREDLEISIKKAAGMLNLDTDYTDPNQLSIFVPNYGDALEIHLLDKDRFNMLRADETYLPNYGNNLYITMHENNGQILIPFIKEILNDFPDLLVYNDEKNALAPYIFSKAHIDAFQDNNFLANLYQPPADLGNLA